MTSPLRKHLFTNKNLLRATCKPFSTFALRKQKWFVSTALKIENWDRHLYCVSNYTRVLPYFQSERDASIGHLSIPSRPRTAKSLWVEWREGENRKAEKRERPGDWYRRKTGGARKVSRRGKAPRGGRQEQPWREDPPHLMLVLSLRSLSQRGWPRSSGLPTPNIQAWVLPIEF